MNETQRSAPAAASTGGRIGNDAESGGKWFRRALWLAILLAGAVSLSASISDPDLWGHVQYGRDVLREGRIPETSTYTYSVEGYRWINHENLTEIVFALLVDTLGPESLLILKALLGMGLLALIMRNGVRQDVPLLVAGGVALLVATNIAFHWSVRPQVFTYSYFALLVVLLSFCFQGWEGRWHLVLRRTPEGEPPPTLVYSSRRMRYLWLAPAIFFFWANTHGGFAAGLAIFIAYLGLRSLEVLLVKGRESLGLLLRFGMMMIVAVLATLVNPYGPGLYRWLFVSLGSPRPEIIEWWPPEMWTTNAFPLWLMLGLWAGGLLLSRRSRDFTQTVLMAVVLWQALDHQRHIPFFAILFGFWMPPHIASLLKRTGLFQGAEKVAQQPAPYLKWGLAIGFGGAYALLGYKLYERLHDLTVEKNNYPVSAFQYIADHDLEGRMVVTFNWAQYAIAAFGPKEPGDRGILISFDGRFRTCYPQEVIDMNFDMVLGYSTCARWRGSNSPPFDGGHRVLDYNRPNLVLISRHQKHSVHVIEQHTDEWTLLYQDELAQLWGRKDVYGDPCSVDYLPLAQRHISDDPQQGYASWPALPVRKEPTRHLALDH